MPNADHDVEIYKRLSFHCDSLSVDKLQREGEVFSLSCRLQLKLQTTVDLSLTCMTRAVR